MRIRKRMTSRMRKRRKERGRVGDEDEKVKEMTKLDAWELSVRLWYGASRLNKNVIVCTVQFER